MRQPEDRICLSNSPLTFNYETFFGIAPHVGVVKAESPGTGLSAVSLVRKIIGIVFLGLGVVSLFLTVLQGILFILIGLALLSPRQRQGAADRALHAQWPADSDAH